MKVIVVNQSGCRIDAGVIKRKAGRILKKLKKNWVVGIFFVPKKKIRDLNRKYRRKNKGTDVLSFEMKEDGYLGDIIISPEVAKKNAREYGVNYSEEVSGLVIHGLLHLLGYDHKLKKEKAKMFKIQDQLLKEVWSRYA
ncbi:rRNA maturation RNase YbeY [Candidatus Margulisiibacteriota bacterium]